jgi:hypothetical protein
MPDTNETIRWSFPRETSMNPEKFREVLNVFVKKALESGDWSSTIRAFRSPSTMRTVTGGVLEKNDSGLYDAALDTEEGRIVLRDARRTDRYTQDPQVVSGAPSSERTSRDPDELIRALKESCEATSTAVLCCIELARFNQDQRLELLPLLWNVILHQRDSNDPNRLVGVAAAMRKYISIMPMERLGELAVLFKAGHRSQISIELEIEIAKTVHRNFLQN